jgi:hypothetical protein
VLFHVFQQAVSVQEVVGVCVAVGVAVGVDVTAGVPVGVEVAGLPKTRISTHQDLVPPLPSPNRMPLAFWNFQ